MPDYRSMFDHNWLRAWDLAGRDWTLEIRKVQAGVLEDKKRAKKDKAPIVYFKGAKKPLGLNRTNAKTIAAIYGNNTDEWVGKTVTLYPTTTEFGNQTVDCIRVRPQEPKGKAQTLPTAAPVAAQEQASDGPAACDTGTCGACTMCLEAADAERRAQEAS
jgi:hypothetical protein